MKKFFYGSFNRFLAAVIALAVIFSGGMFTDIHIKAAGSGYWFFMGNGGELLFSPTGGYDCPHVSGFSLYQDMPGWKSKIDFPVTAVRRDGYILSGWNTKADGTGMSLPNTNEGFKKGVSDSSVYLYAQWSPISYSVNWDANGGLASQSKTTVACGSRISSGGIPTATRESDISDGYKRHYEFAGWYTSPVSGNPLSDDAIQVYGGSTFYAHWNVRNEPLDYILCFNGNGGSSSESRRTVARGSAYGGLPVAGRNAAVNDGYTTSYEFAGWYTEPEGGTQVSASTVMQAGNTTVYAHWNQTVAANEYTLNFNGNGGSASEISRTVKRGQAYGALPSALRSNAVSDGYTYKYEFAGWYTAVTGGEAVTSSTVMGAGNTTIYAHWNTVTTANEYKLIFDGNGGISSLNSSNVYRGQPYGALPDAKRHTVTKNGYKTTYSFQGWFTSAGGGSKVSEHTIMGAGNQTLYAHWAESTSPITYNVSFHANTGEGNMQVQTITYGKTAILNSNKFTKTGYLFSGWSYSENGTKAFDDGNAILNLTQSEGEEIKLYALWQLGTFDVVCYDVLLNKDLAGEVANGKEPDKADLNIIGKNTWGGIFGETADAAKLGSDETIGAYYKGLKYIIGTTALVTEKGCTLYRYFEDFSSSKLDGVVLGNGSGNNTNQPTNGEGEDEGSNVNAGDDGIASSDKTENKKDIVIQNGKNVEELDVTRECGANVIADKAFCESSETLRVVHFENASIERVGKGAFENCKGLKEIELPYSINYVGDNAFLGCENLRRVVFCNPDCEIGKNALPKDTVIYCFDGSTAVEYAKNNNIPYEIIKEIGEGLFENEVSMDSFTVPKSVACVSGNAFKNCDNLKVVVFDGMDTVIDGSAGIKKSTSIKCYAGSNAFKFAEKENYPIIMRIGFEADGVTVIQKKQYASNSSIKGLIFGEGINSISSQAFTDCSMLERVIVCGRKLEKIETGAFENCIKLKSFSFSQEAADDVTGKLSYVGDGAFANTSLESILIYNPNCIIENTAKERYTFPADTVMRGWSKSTLKDYCSKYENKFEEIGTSYQIVFNMYDGTGGTEKLYTYTDMDLPDIAAPVKEKHIFRGYILDDILYYNASGKAQMSGRDMHIMSDKIGRSSLIAQWEKEEEIGAQVDSDKTPNTMNPIEGEDERHNEGLVSGAEGDGNTSSGSGDDITSKIDNDEGFLKNRITKINEVSGDSFIKSESDTSTSNKNMDDVNNKNGAQVSVKSDNKKYMSFLGNAIQRPIKGKIYIIGKLKYKVIKVLKKNSKAIFGHVTVIGVKKGNINKIQIPDIVKILGFRMKVTAVSKKAFYKNKHIKEAVIGENVEKIGRKAFYMCSGIMSINIMSRKLESIGGYAFCGCKNLKKVVIMSPKLRAVGKNVFLNVNQYTILKAPSRKTKKYQKMFQG